MVLLTTEAFAIYKVTQVLLRAFLPQVSDRLIGTGVVAGQGVVETSSPKLKSFKASTHKFSKTQN